MIVFIVSVIFSFFYDMSKTEYSDTASFFSIIKTQTLTMHFVYNWLICVFVSDNNGFNNINNDYTIILILYA